MGKKTPKGWLDRSTNDQKGAFDFIKINGDYLRRQYVNLLIF